MSEMNPYDCYDTGRNWKPKSCESFGELIEDIVSKEKNAAKEL